MILIRYSYVEHFSDLKKYLDINIDYNNIKP